MKKFGLSFGVVIVLIIAIVVAVQMGDKTNEAFALVEGERPVWDFEGPFEATPELKERAKTERERLEKLLGKGEFSDYDIEIGIAEQYALVGEGEEAYEHLLNAIMLSEVRSLAFVNLGTLLGKVGAPKSAKIAFEMALDRDDTVQNRIQYIQHLEQYFADDLDLVESSHTLAIKKFPESEVLQQRYNSWKKLHGR